MQERKAQREREQEGEMFGDKEAFVTGAFKQRMIERQAYEKKQKVQDAIDGMVWYSIVCKPYNSLHHL